jgi:hypothetical protein
MYFRMRTEFILTEYMLGTQWFKSEPMTQAHNRSRFSIRRFSLRGLLAVVTLFCLVLAYQANVRLRQNHFIAEQRQIFDGDTVVPAFENKFDLRAWACPPSKMLRKNPLSPLNWLAGTSYVSVAVAIPASDVNARIGIAHNEGPLQREYFWISPSQKDYIAAKRLFPRAAVYTFTLTKDGWVQVYVGEFSNEWEKVYGVDSNFLYDWLEKASKRSTSSRDD